jgi:hypothetical protein
MSQVDRPTRHSFYLGRLARADDGVSICSVLGARQYFRGRTCHGCSVSARNTLSEMKLACWAMVWSM